MKKKNIIFILASLVVLGNCLVVINELCNDNDDLPVNSDKENDILSEEVSISEDLSIDVSNSDLINEPEVEYETVSQGIFRFKGPSVSIYAPNYTEDIEIPSSYRYKGEVFDVTHIESNISNASKLIIGDSIKSINMDRISPSSNIEYEVSENNQYFSSIDGVLYSKDKKDLIAYPRKKEFDNSYLNNVVNIGKKVFSRKKLLGKSIILPDSIETIGEGAFANCYVNNITFSNNLKEIGKEAFSINCISELKLPDSLLYVREGAFSLSSNLQSIYIGKNTQLDVSFSRCYSLKNISVHEDNPYYSSIDNVLYSKDKKTLIIYSGGLGNTRYEVIPECEKIEDASNSRNLTFDMSKSKVTEIADYAFSLSSGINPIFSNCLKSIGTQAFYNCHITSIDLPESLLYIGDMAFYENSLQEVIIPSNVVILGQSCFANNDLSTIYIPASVKEINVKFVSGNRNLTDIIIDENNLYYCMVSGVLYTKDLKKLIMYPSYLNGESYSVVEGCEYIEPYAFNNAKFTSIKLPNSLLVIDEYAFINCTEVKALDIPNSVNLIKERAFSKCKSLESVTLPNGLTEISNYLFSECYNLKEIVIPESVKTIGDYAFDCCSMLTNITLSNNLETIGNSAFRNCVLINRLNLPESLISIGDDAFYDCEIEYIYIPSSLETIGANAFDYGFAKEINVSNENKYYTSIDGNLYSKDVTILYAYAFGKNAGSFYIPRSVITIKEGAFSNEDNVNSLDDLYVGINVIYFEYQFIAYDINIYTEHSHIPLTWSYFEEGLFHPKINYYFNLVFSE